MLARRLYILKSIVENHYGPENPTHLYSNYLLSVRSLFKSFSKSLTHLVIQKDFKIDIVSIYTEGKEPKGL